MQLDEVEVEEVITELADEYDEVIELDEDDELMQIIEALDRLVEVEEDELDDNAEVDGGLDEYLCLDTQHIYDMI